MQPIANLINKKQLSAERFNKPTAVNCTTVQVDNLINNLLDLINPEFKSWYAKAIYKLGRQRVAELAIVARRGANPPKYFSWLLKKEIKAAPKEDTS